MDTGEPSQFNRYMYANNDPVNMLDPDGKDGVGIKIEGNIPLGTSPLGIEIGVTFSVNNEGGTLKGGRDVGVKGNVGLTVGLQNASAEVAIDVSDGSIADSTAHSVEVNAVGNVIPTPVGLVGPAVDIGINGRNAGDPADNNGILDTAADALGAETMDVSNASLGVSYGTPGITATVVGASAARSTSGTHVNGTTREENQ